MTIPKPPADSEAAARRTGLALALLSLDSTRAFLPLIGFPIEIDPPALQDGIRSAILENREAYLSGYGAIPDLLSRTRYILSKRLGPAAAEATETWVRDVFVYGPDDYRPSANWKYVLADARRDRSRWRRLELPAAISARVREMLDDALDLQPLHAIDDAIGDDPLSLWDIEMYARHGFHDERREPYIHIQQTYSGLHFRRFLIWLISQASAEDLARLHMRASELMREKPMQYAEGELPQIISLV